MEPTRWARLAVRCGSGGRIRTSNQRINNPLHDRRAAPEWVLLRDPILPVDAGRDEVSTSNDVDSCSPRVIGTRYGYLRTRTR